MNPPERGPKVGTGSANLAKLSSLIAQSPIKSSNTPNSLPPTNTHTSNSTRFSNATISSAVHVPATSKHANVSSQPKAISTSNNNSDLYQKFSFVYSSSHVHIYASSIKNAAKFSFKPFFSSAGFQCCSNSQTTATTVWIHRSDDRGEISEAARGLPATEIKQRGSEKGCDACKISTRRFLKNIYVWFYYCRRSKRRPPCSIQLFARRSSAFDRISKRTICCSSITSDSRSAFRCSCKISRKW